MASGTYSGASAAAAARADRASHCDALQVAFGVARRGTSGTTTETLRGPSQTRRTGRS